MLKEERLSCIMQVLLFQTGLSHFEKFSTSVSEMTISRLLKHKALYLGRVTDKPNSMRARKVLSPVVEQATFAWFSLME